MTLDSGYRLDLVVDEAIVIEIKAVEALSRLHEAQILTYLRLSGFSAPVWLRSGISDEFQRRTVQARSSQVQALTSCPYSSFVCFVLSLAVAVGPNPSHAWPWHSANPR
jgi:hypothetical protein